MFYVAAGRRGGDPSVTKHGSTLNLTTSHGAHPCTGDIGNAYTRVTRPYIIPIITRIHTPLGRANPSRSERPDRTPSGTEVVESRVANVE